MTSFKNKALSISEFSRLTHIPQDTIRLYEKMKLITPERDRNNNRVYYQNDLIIGLVILIYKKLGKTYLQIRNNLEESTHTEFHLHRQIMMLNDKQNLCYELSKDLKKMTQSLTDIQLERNFDLLKKF